MMLKVRWLLPLWFIIAYLLPLPDRPLWTPDETRYAEISREMIQSGDWVVPHLLGLDYFEKPIAGHWANSLSQLLLGETNLAVRFACVTATALSGLLIYLFARQLWPSRRKATAAALIYLSCLLVYGMGTYSLLDPLLTLWINGAMLAFYLAFRAATNRERIGYYLLLGLCCGLGFLTKGFIALAVPVVAIAPFMLLQKRFLELVKYGPLALFGAALISAPWALLVHLRAPDYWHYFFWIEHVQRFAGADAQHASPFWYYLPGLLAGLIPWLGLLPGTLLGLWRQGKGLLSAQHASTLYLVAWTLLPLTFFSLAKGKLLTYILPCFAPLALLLTDHLFCILKAHTPTALRLNGYINLAFALLAALTLALFGWGMVGKTPLYGPDEMPRLVLGLICFLFWAGCACISLRQKQKLWFCAAFCPLLCVLLYPAALPLVVVNSKLPESFLRTHQEELDASRYLLSSDVGLGVTLGWQFKSSDIVLVGADGELTYGLSKSEGSDRYIPTEDFAIWLAQARKLGQVALLVKQGKATNAAKEWPEADLTLSSHRLLLLIYRQQP